MVALCKQRSRCVLLSNLVFQRIMERKNMVNLSVVGTYCIFYLFFLLDLNLRAADRGFVSLPKVNTDSLVVSGY